MAIKASPVPVAATDMQMPPAPANNPYAIIKYATFDVSLVFNLVYNGRPIIRAELTLFDIIMTR